MNRFLGMMIVPFVMFVLICSVFGGPPKSVPLVWTPSQLMVRYPPVWGAAPCSCHRSWLRKLVQRRRCIEGTDPVNVWGIS